MFCIELALFKVMYTPMIIVLQLIRHFNPSVNKENYQLVVVGLFFNSGTISTQYSKQ